MLSVKPPATMPPRTTDFAFSVQETWRSCQLCSLDGKTGIFTSVWLGGAGDGCEAGDALSLETPGFLSNWRETSCERIRSQQWPSFEVGGTAGSHTLKVVPRPSTLSMVML